MTSSPWCVAAGAWLLAAGLLTSGGIAPAFADPGSDAKHSDRASASSGHGSHDRGRVRHESGASSGGDARAAGDDGASTPGTGHISRRPAHRARAGAKIDATPDTTSGTTTSTTTDATVDTTTKPTTMTTRSLAQTLDTAAPDTSADSATPASAAFAAADVDAVTTDDATTPTNTQAANTQPANDSQPTTQQASPPVTFDLQPSATDAPPTTDAAPSTDAAGTLANDTTQPAVPVVDLPPTGSDQTSGSSDTASTTVAAVVEPVTSQDVANATTSGSTPDSTATGTEPAASTPAPPAPTQAAAPPTEVPPAPATEVVEVAEDELAPNADDENARRAASAARSGPALSPLQILRIFSASGAGSAGESTRVPTLLDGGGQVHADSAASASGVNTAQSGATTSAVAARGMPKPSMPTDLQTFLQTCGQLVVAVSLSAMFLAALPGLAGLILPALAGMHFGYRQAKAGRAVRASGIGHLVRSAPIGVVRSGGLVSLHTRRRRIPETSTATIDRDAA